PRSLFQLEFDFESTRERIPANCSKVSGDRQTEDKEDIVLFLSTEGRPASSMFRNQNYRKSSAERNASGFSLSEVVISLGIVAAVMIPVTALIPHGLLTLTEATEESTIARILESVSSDARMIDFQEIESLHDTTRFFDNQGTETQQNNTDRRPIYTARIRVLSNQQTPVLPGGELPSTQDHLSRLIVEVAATRGQSIDFDNTDLPIKRFPLFIPRLEDSATVSSGNSPSG
ncbi:MAG: Verru_Chthon cassette protein B, partial [Verrucomicrobiota bacterium]